MTRKFMLVTAIILCFALLLAGCGKSAAERAAEALIKNATGTDVEIKGDKVEIEGSDGEKVTVGGSISWPGDKMGDLPKLSGTIEAFFESGEVGGALTCVGTSKKEAEEYIQALKDLGYTEDAYEFSDETMMQYYANNGSCTVSFTFFPEGGHETGQSSCTLTYEKKN